MKTIILGFQRSMITGDTYFYFGTKDGDKIDGIRMKFEKKSHFQKIRRLLKTKETKTVNDDFGTLVYANATMQEAQTAAA